MTCTTCSFKWRRLREKTHRCNHQEIHIPRLPETSPSGCLLKGDQSTDFYHHSVCFVLFRDSYGLLPFRLWLLSFNIRHLRLINFIDMAIAHFHSWEYFTVCIYHGWFCLSWWRFRLFSNFGYFLKCCYGHSCLLGTEHNFLLSNLEPGWLAIRLFRAWP